MDQSFIATGEETHFSIWIHGDLSDGADVIFDHSYLVTEEDFQSCTTTFNLQGPSEFYFKPIIGKYHIIIYLQNISISLFKIKFMNALSSRYHVEAFYDFDSYYRKNQILFKVEKIS